MTTSPASVLLSVQLNVAPAHEHALNDWYHLHVPHLLREPGYRWGRRYVAVSGATKYLALYEVADRADLPALLGPDPGHRSANVNREFELFGGLQGLSDVAINVYEQISGPPFAALLMQGDYPLSLVQVDCRPEAEDEFNRWYDTSHVPNLLKVPGYVSGMRFRLVDDPALAHLGMAPAYLALYEIADQDAILGMSDPEWMTQAAREELQNWISVGAPMVRGETRWNIYRPLSKHWPAR